MLINYSKEISKNLRNIAMILPQLTGVLCTMKQSLKPS